MRTFIFFMLLLALLLLLARPTHSSELRALKNSGDYTLGGVASLPREGPKGALFKAENILREALTEAKAKTPNAIGQGSAALRRSARTKCWALAHEDKR